MAKFFSQNHLCQRRLTTNQNLKNKIMKKLIIVLSVFLAINTISLAQTESKSSEKEDQRVAYVCPMHPNEMSDKEGKCSKCGMDMKKVTVAKHEPGTKGSQTTYETKYVCKMDGTTSDKAGKCSKCGKALTAINDQDHKHMYGCPMHPNEMSDKMGKCSICGMDMKKVTVAKHEPGTKGSQTTYETKYVCKMDGSTSDKSGKCPKCGMKMSKMKNEK